MSDRSRNLGLNAGYDKVLTDVTYGGRNTQMNRVVYSQLAVSTIGGTTHQLIIEYEYDKNGYEAWNNFVSGMMGMLRKVKQQIL